MTQKRRVPIAAIAAAAGIIAIAGYWITRKPGNVLPAPDSPADAPVEEGTVGPPVAEGSVWLSEAQAKKFGVETSVAAPGRLHVEVALPGEVTLNADRIAHVVPRVSGVVTEVRKNLGDRVRQGEVMAVMESRELADSAAALLAARSRLVLAQANFTREERLWQKRISPEQDYIQAKNLLAEAGIEVRAAEQKLRALGFSEEYIAGLPGTSETNAIVYEMTAPYDATIIEKHISLGEVLGENSTAFVIADLSSVWVNLDVHQRDLPLLRLGQVARIGTGNTAPSAEGRISFLDPIAEETNRTIHARVVIANPDGRWRPGLFVTGRINVDDAPVEILVPNEALVMVGGAMSVFLKVGDRYIPQVVVTGRTNETSTEIMGGLQAGQTYVVKGAFTLKSELGKPEAEK
jgi:cobalt-zinc-cadmium efflux system membrane fusion protein